MTKTTKTFTIEYDIYTKASAAGINLSEAAENGIRHELIRTGGNIKTIEELRVEREIKERQRKVKEAETEAKKALCLAQGKVYVDEKSPMLIPVKEFMKKGK